MIQRTKGDYLSVSAQDNGVMFDRSQLRGEECPVSQAMPADLSSFLLDLDLNIFTQTHRQSGTRVCY